MKKLILIIILFFLSLPVFSQTEKILEELHNECRHVRGHAYMIQQMIDEDNFNLAVAKAHFNMVKQNIHGMELTLHKIVDTLTEPKKKIIESDLNSLLDLCERTKPIVADLEEELTKEDIEPQRIRRHAIRIHRNLRTAMEIQEGMREKLK